jgi:hypothetical protein
MAKITPANGVLNAAATPAAPPATSRPCSLTAERAGSQRRAWCMTPAASCTDGPSRPSDMPASRLAAVRPNLAKARRSDTNVERCAGVSAGSSAAITCGMPEPAAPGAKRCVAQTMAAAPSGVTTSGAQGSWARRLPNACSAASATQVKATTARPASAA